MLLAALRVDPAFPWSLPVVGVPLLLIVTGLLAAVTVWTYLGAQGSSWRRLALILGLRLGALLIVFLLILRPSMAYEQDAVAVPSKLIIVVDYSASMKIKDELDNASRWDHVRLLLKSPRVEELLKRLGRDQRIEVAYYQFAEDLKDYNRDGQARGKHTFTGLGLHELFKRYDKEKQMRGVLWFSDGADNGSVPAYEKAEAWRILCPIHTFAAGKTSTSLDQRDIFFDDDNIKVDPSPVPVKGKLTMRGVVHAPGFDGQRVRLTLWLQGAKGPAWQAAVKEKLELPGARDNEVSLSCDAPLQPGEYKATLKIDPVPGEVTDANNQITTYFTVTKEGISILWVEGKKRLESVFAIRFALSKDPQFRVYYAEKLLQRDPPPEQEDWFDFSKRHYDVIVIGDISAARFAGGKRDVFEKIAKMVTESGTGLMMMGGQETFGTLDEQGGPNWPRGLAGPVLSLLPGEIEYGDSQIAPKEKKGMEFVPTDAGLDFMLRIGADKKASKHMWEDLWRKSGGLDGMTKPGKEIPGKTLVLAKADDVPIMLSMDRGKGRTLAFGGDTTHMAWRRSRDAILAYERFWQQVMLWLAHREEAPGKVWIKLDRRRIPAAADSRLEITVGLRGKDGNRVENGNFTATVVAPDKQPFKVTLAPKTADEHHGFFADVHQAGEYEVHVTGEGVDVKGNRIGSPEKPETATAHFLAFAKNRESTDTAANHDFLKKLAEKGGGRFHLAAEHQLVQFLESLSAQQQALTRPKPQLWPDWRRNPPTDGLGDQVGTLWNSTALPAFLLFCTLVCCEWYLRRRWGMV